MPSDILTPLALDWAGGALTTSHDRDTLTAPRLLWRGGNLTTSFSGESLTVATPVLDRLTRHEQFPGVDQGTWTRFMSIWQKQADKIEEAFEAIDERDTQQDATLAAVAQSLALAQAAVDSILAANRREALKDSFTDPASVLTADNSGTITIAAHTRTYGDADATEVSVDGGTISGLTLGQTYQVYYQDAARTGGAVSYQYTTANVAQTGNTHVVGSVAVPNAGEASTSGSGPSAPGSSVDDSREPYEKTW